VVAGYSNKIFTQLAPLVQRNKHIWSTSLMLQHRQDSFLDELLKYKCFKQVKTFYNRAT
jgi:hypothetical protein